MHKRERIGDIEIAFDDHGHGPAVMMLHPFPFDSRVWADNLPALIGAGHRVIAIDYPGFGDSPAPPAELSLVQLAELLDGLRDRLGMSTVALIGLSMGGYVALAYARRFPARLWALVLADTRADADSPAAFQGRADALRAIQDQGVEAYLQQSLPRLLATDAAPRDLARVLSLAERRAHTLVAALGALRDRPSRTAELAEIACPTLVLAGTADRVTPPGEMRAMADAISGARFVEIARAGHLSNLESSTAFNDAVVGFLREASSLETEMNEP
jgi:pimeloyl-ACP methyl ester carboxylesterase